MATVRLLSASVYITVYLFGCPPVEVSQPVMDLLLVLSLPEDMCGASRTVHRLELTDL